MFPPTVKVCPVRECLAIPYIIVSIPLAWYRCLRKPVDLVLTEEEAQHFAALLLAPKRDEIQFDDEGHVIPARADHVPQPVPVREIDLIRYTVADTLHVPMPAEEKIAGKYHAGSGV